MKLNLIYVSWGKLYYNQLILSLKSFNFDIIKISKKHKVALSLYLDNDSIIKLKKNIIYKNFKKNKIKITFNKINDLINKQTTNKFSILNELQIRSFKDSINYDYLFPIYPDYINANNSLVEHVKSLENGYLATFTPVICLNYEEVLEKLKNELKKNNQISNNKLALLSSKYIHNIQKFFIIEGIDKFPLSPAWMMVKSLKNNIVMKCFHSTPCFFSTKIVKDYKIKKSIDEDFVRNFYHIKEKIKFFDNSKNSLICSLKSVKDPPTDITNLKGSIKDAKIWINENTNEMHKFSALTNYILKHNNEDLSAYIDMLKDYHNRLISKDGTLISKIFNYFK